VNQASGNPAKQVEEKVTEMAKPIFDVISEDIEEPHIPKDMHKTTMEKHRGKEGEDLFESRKLSGKDWVRITHRNNPIEEKGLSELGTQGELPEEGKAIGDDDQDIDHRIGF